MTTSSPGPGRAGSLLQLVDVCQVPLASTAQETVAARRREAPAAEARTADASKSRREGLLARVVAMFPRFNSCVTQRLDLARLLRSVSEGLKVRQSKNVGGVGRYAVRVGGRAWE